MKKVLLKGTFKFHFEQEVELTDEIFELLDNEEYSHYDRNCFKKVVLAELIEVLTFPDDLPDKIDIEFIHKIND